MSNKTTIYKVIWYMKSDSFFNSQTIYSGQSAPQKLHKHKYFVSKDKADKLLTDITNAFKILDYSVEGNVQLIEEYYE